MFINILKQQITYKKNVFVSKNKQEYVINTTESYIRLLKKWGKIYNLTANDDIVSLLPHIMDSFSVGHLTSLLHVKHCADLGSGAGFPSIVAAIMNPDILFTLFEVDINKSAFLRQVIIEMSLKNVILSGDWKKSTKKFPLLLSKGFLSPSNFMDILEKVLDPGGKALICTHQPITHQPTHSTQNLIESQFFFHYIFRSRLHTRCFSMIQL